MASFLHFPVHAAPTQTLQTRAVMRHRWTIEFARVEWLSTRRVDTGDSSELDQIPDEAGAGPVGYRASNFHFSRVRQGRCHGGTSKLTRALINQFAPLFELIFFSFHGLDLDILSRCIEVTPDATPPLSRWVIIQYLPSRVCDSYGVVELSW